MKKCKLLVFLFLLMLPIVVKADHMYKVDMKINILRDGTAHITETWDVEATSGTEWYKDMKNLGNSELSNFRVSMDGNRLTYKSWNVDESLSEKKGYYGINYTTDGLELCFGKYDYNRHIFTLNYTLSNYVFNTDDSQILYWTMLPNATIDDFSVEVMSYYEFPDTLEVWGYGYEGYVGVEDGKIIMSNDGNLNNDYVVLLAKFPLNTFNTSNTYSEFNTFNDVYEKAQKDASLNGFADVLALCIIGFVFGIFGLVLWLVFSNKYGYEGNKKIDKKNVPMFREIPCNKDIYYANTLIKLNNVFYGQGNIIGAVILKWIRDNKVIFKNDTTGVFNKETSVIDLTNNATFDTEFEEKLFNMMRAASKDGMLEAKELESWCRKNYNKYYELIDGLEKNMIKYLTNNGYIRNRVNRKECKKKKVLSDQIYNDSVELFGLKKYLEEFSRIDKKEVMEVKLWDEYLMFAHLFGIADKVAKQLKDLYPEVLEQANYDYDTLVFVNHISTSSSRAASSSRSSSSSGGSGSFGGGGSMGGR